MKGTKNRKKRGKTKQNSLTNQPFMKKQNRGGDSVLGIWQSEAAGQKLSKKEQKKPEQKTQRSQKNMVGVDFELPQWEGFM